MWVANGGKKSPDDCYTNVSESGTTPKNRRPNRERMRRALAGLNRMVWVSSQGLGMSQVSICS